VIAFITTIRHPHNSNDYARVGELLTRTLRSVLGQTDDDLVVVVVHNRRPNVPIEDARVHYLQVDFARPSAQSGAMIGFPEFVRDKGTKCAVGLAYARELHAGHVMFFDADDLVSNRIAALANAAPDHPGWYFETGYIHSVGTRSIQFVPHGFHMKNGSTSVVRTDLIGLPDSVTPGSSQQEIVTLAGTDLVDHFLGMHGFWQDRLATMGSSMEPTPFPGAVWMIGTGENHSGNLISGRQRQRISPETSAEFTLERPSFVSSLQATARLRFAQASRKLRP
jgi:hypothetical protein